MNVCRLHEHGLADNVVLFCRVVQISQDVMGMLTTPAANGASLLPER